MYLVCLVSRQAMANVIPFLMYKPSNVFLLSTEQEKECAIHLQSFFTKKKSKVYLYNDIDAYDSKNLIKRLDEIFNKYSDNDITLNITGGTKIMALTAYEYFKEKQKSIFYCNTGSLEILNLFPQKKSEPININISIEDYLAAYGYEITNEKNINFGEDIENFLNIIFPSNINSFTKFVNKVRAEKSLNTPRFNFADKEFKIEKHYDVCRLEHISSKTFIKSGGDFVFGNWLEFLTAKILSKALKSEIKIGVKIVSPENNYNEIDVMFVKNYQLNIVSCKSGSFKNTGIKEHLSELEVLRNLTGGTFGKAYFVYSNDKNEQIINRANELKIKAVHISELNNLV